MNEMVSLITGVSFVCPTVWSSTDQRKHQSSASLAFVRGSTGHRWIPLTKGQWRGGYFHLMTSSWWWRHEVETLSALLALCEGNPTMAGGRCVSLTKGQSGMPKAFHDCFTSRFKHFEQHSTLHFDTFEDISTHLITLGLKLSMNEWMNSWMHEWFQKICWRWALIDTGRSNGR